MPSYGRGIGFTTARDYDRILSNGEANMDRLWGVDDTNQAATGVAYFTYFTALKTETIAAITMWSGGTPAAATPTTVKMGVYSVAANGDLTRVAVTANDTSLFATANTKYAKALTASFVKAEGTRYATAVLVVSAGACPTFYGRAMAGSTTVDTLLGDEPRRTAQIGSQTDLDTGYLSANLVVTRRNALAYLTTS